MNLYEFMEQNNIAIVAKADFKNKKFDIVKRDVELESFDLFEQLILFSNTDKLLASLEEQILPRIWAQGNTKCVICKLNSENVIALFYDTCMEAKENYFYAKQLELLLKDVI
jgi:vacuolar-type H+-ATPase subunit C/Vma6